jgi:hypothetical protein
MNLGELVAWCLENNLIPEETLPDEPHPMLIVGTSDCDRVFHPFGVATCSREAHLDFKFLFNSYVLGREKIGLNNREILEKPISLMADAASAISNGLNESRLNMNVRGSLKTKKQF